MADALRVQGIDDGAYRGGSDQLAAVRIEQQPGPFGDREGRGELRGDAATLVVRQAEADDATTGVLDG